MSDSLVTLTRKASSGGCGQDSEAARRGIGAVVIGRNEGERLIRCLRSLVGRVGQIVYVDSGSTDGSPAFAESLGVKVIELDMSHPFTVARGRNAGWRYLNCQDRSVEFVQFVDGDCEVVDGWIDTAYQTLIEREDVVAVCGRRREEFPEASIYHYLADLEWDRPTGDVRYCGGDVMMRMEAIAAVDGYNDDVLAGEEAELCVRLRRRGGAILRIRAEMTLHDIGMTRFRQWWKRAVRSGHGYAEGAHLHGRGPDRHNVRQVHSAIFWGALAPVLAMAGSAITPGHPLRIAMIILAILCLYALQTWRIFRRYRSSGASPRAARLSAVFCMVAKLPELLGIALYWRNRLLRRHTRLIEYKDLTPHSTEAEPTDPS